VKSKSSGKKWSSKISPKSIESGGKFPINECCDALLGRDDEEEDAGPNKGALNSDDIITPVKPIVSKLFLLFVTWFLSSS